MHLSEYTVYTVEIIEETKRLGLHVLCFGAAERTFIRAFIPANGGK